MTTFDIAVIGAGPGGYVAAIKAAQEGRSVCLIEKEHVGGTCLNVGCIPTKTLLAAAAVLKQVLQAATFGIEVGSVRFDYSKMRQRKDDVISRMRKGLSGLIQANGITLIQGTAQLLSKNQIQVTSSSGDTQISAQSIIIATGSAPLDIPAFPCDHRKIFNSTSILELTQLPKTLAIIGGGYIGCEFASLYAALGVKVTILEALPSIVMAQGKGIAEVLSQAFVRQGIDIRTGVTVEGIDDLPEGIRVRLQGRDPLLCDAALVAVGRKISSAGLGLEKAGVQISDKGVVLVDDRMQTNVAGIYAIGDITGKFLLAHVASHQGIIAASNAAGKEARIHYEAVPAVIFTDPEIATVGLTPEQAQEKGHDVCIGKFPFQALGKAVATGHAEGFAQIVTDRKTGQILGAQAVGHEASNLIAEMGLAIANELTIECIADTIHAHPTIAEVWMEAALLAEGAPIHLPPKKKCSP